MTLEQALTNLTKLFTTVEIAKYSNVNRTSICLYSKPFGLKSLHRSIKSYAGSYEDEFNTLYEHMHKNKHSGLIRNPYKKRFNFVDIHQKNPMCKKWSEFSQFIKKN